MVLPLCFHIDLAVSKPIDSFIYSWYSEVPQIPDLVGIHFIHFVEHSLDSFNLNLNVIQWVPSLGWEDPLEKEKATHSSIVACLE